MIITKCDLCRKTNSDYGNKEVFTHFSYPARTGMSRMQIEIDICLHCLNQIEDLMDKIKKEN